MLDASDVVALLKIDSIAPSVGVLAALLAVAAVALRASRFYRGQVEAAAGRFASLDGLRGFLAFGVFLHHAHINYFYFRTGRWGAPESQFYAMIGPAAVGLFFLITGFLFWNKAIAKEGKIEPGELYLSRLCRIAPMYLASMAAVTVLVLMQTGFHLNGPAGRLMSEIGRMLTMGFSSPKRLNGVLFEPLNASVTWTLHYEWLFYLALPLLALLVRPTRFVMLLVVAVGLRLGFAESKTIGWLFLFAGGMAAAHLVRVEAVRRAMGRNRVALAFGLLWVYALQSAMTTRELAVVLPGFGLFLALACGADLFGLLTCRPAKLLGTISYSVYLLHGIVLYVVLNGVSRWWSVATMSEPWFWGLQLICGVVVLGVSCVSFRWVEQPGIELGHQLAKRRKPPAAVQEAVGSERA